MSNSSAFNFTIEQLFSDLETEDELGIGDNITTKAKNGDDEAMNDIGDIYYCRQQYDKSMAWYRLAAAKNNYTAQNSIGVLYYKGFGVPQDYLLALEWYLKAAMQNHAYARGNIGDLFEDGLGVTVDKYKALEWYQKSSEYPNTVKALTDQGIQLTEKDKDKSIEQLIIETEDILSEEKCRREKARQEENETLKKSKFKLEEELRAKDAKIKLLEEEMQNYQLNEEQKQQTIDSLLADKTKREGKQSEENKTLQQFKEKLDKELAVDIESLKKEMQTYRSTVEQKQKENDYQQDFIKQLKQEIDKSNSEIQSLKMANTIQMTQLELKDSHIKTLEKLIGSPCAVSEEAVESTSKRINDLEAAVETINKRMGDLEKANQNLQMLLEQERRLRDNEVMLAKQETRLLINKEKQEKRDLEIW